MGGWIQKKISHTITNTIRLFGLQIINKIIVISVKKGPQIRKIAQITLVSLEVFGKEVLAKKIYKFRVN